MISNGGERGIRTLDTREDILPFQGSALDHYATSPGWLLANLHSTLYSLL